jgi:hypothetical protein
VPAFTIGKSDKAKGKSAEHTAESSNLFNHNLQEKTKRSREEFAVKIRKERR